MPGVTITESPPVTRADLAELARAVADFTCGLDAHEIASRIRAGADPDLTGTVLTQVWDMVLWAASDLHRITGGLCDWRDIDATLTCQDRQGAAIEIAAERLEDALDALTGDRP
jgi:hypothetical protein